MKKNVNKVEDNTNVLLSYILFILMILIKWTMRIQFQSFSLWNVLYSVGLFQTSFVEKFDWTRFIHSPSRLRCLLLSVQMICTKFQIKQTILVIAGELETNERLLTRRNMTNSERVHRVFLFL